MRALLVGCDGHTALSIRLALRLRWPELELIAEKAGQQGLRLVHDLSPELVFIAIEPPPSDLDSLEFLQEMRPISDAVLIAVSDRPSDIELTAALEAGADEYLSLPVNGPVLLARVTAALRRAKKPLEPGQLSLAGGRLQLHPLSYEATVAGQPLRLTPTEFKLLHCLARERGHVVAHEALQKAIGDDGYSGSLDCVHKYIQRLRQKLRAALGDDIRLLSVPRVGYQLIDTLA